jgi:hypothetical protein
MSYQTLFFAGAFMITYKLTAIIFAAVTLFTLTFLSVSGCVSTMAMGAIALYGDCHSS